MPDNHHCRVVVGFGRCRNGSKEANQLLESLAIVLSSTTAFDSEAATDSQKRVEL